MVLFSIASDRRSGSKQPKRATNVKLHKMVEMNQGNYSREKVGVVYRNVLIMHQFQYFVWLHFDLLYLSGHFNIISQGIIVALRDGFGFIRCAERDARLFFHFNEVIFDKVCASSIQEYTELSIE